MDSSLLRQDALAIFGAAVKAADAANAVRLHFSIDADSLTVSSARLPLAGFDRIHLVSVGKAAVEMAAAVEDIVGSRLATGLAVTKHGHATSRLRACRVIESAHPVPDEAGLQASIAIRELVQHLTVRDLLIVAISGGASALLPAPVEPITLNDKQRTTDLLLRAGADIFQLNAVRKHLSALKGGRLAALAYPATVVSLMLSDVIGDPLDVIGSGPTAPDESTYADALVVLEQFELLHGVPPPVRAYLEAGVAGTISETPKPGDPLFGKVHNVIVGSSRLALEAAAAAAKQLGYQPLILSSTVQGETREVARLHAEILRESLASGNPIAPPACILSGGETTVTVRGQGKGGRNQEFALAAALALNGLPNALVLSGGTDGTDGPTDAAGAIATGTTVARAQQAGLRPADHLKHNDAYPFFAALDDLIKTGPTGTNVMDIHLMLAGS